MSHVFTAKAMKPRFTPLPSFDITVTPRKSQRIKQYLDSGVKDYAVAVRKTDNDFKAWEKAKLDALKAAEEAPAMP